MTTDLLVRPTRPIGRQPRKGPLPDWMTRSYSAWAFKPYAGRPIRPDEAEAFLNVQCWCLAIAAGVTAVIAPPAVVMMMVAMEVGVPGKIAAIMVFLNAIWIPAALGMWRFAGAIKHLVKHIERFGMSVRPGHEVVDQTDDDGAAPKRDPLSDAMGIDR